MKKKILLPITILLIILLSACTNYSSSPITPNDNSMVINIKNNANFDFYEVQAHLVNHSPAVVNADGSKIEKGELISFELLEEDIALDGKVEMKIEILDSNSKEKSKDAVAINKKVTLELDNNKEVFFEITGNSIKESDLKRVK
ncbi:hypothetical protein QNH20_14115 [Neobacillus sp. WH10]|uniref:hypothetical protein n=1 Tax=Neobacillus sp. WH10 TaxID=3047873 RepID=UPI0024C20753|nr:hypothetical protein [Neobacillus sp. WH10]WHY75286.1 hypothetical protein QNH20_14115 [Neobacillus sp. WH10]